MVGKDKNPAPVGEGREQEKAVSRFGQSEFHITKDGVILLVHQKEDKALDPVPAHTHHVTQSLEWSACCRYEDLAEEAKESLSAATGISRIASICRYFLFRACYRLACIRLQKNTLSGKLHPWNMKYCKKYHR